MVQPAEIWSMDGGSISTAYNSPTSSNAATKHGGRGDVCLGRYYGKKEEDIFKNGESR